MSDADTTEAEDERPDEHFEDVDDGAGCTEIWEHLADEREDD